MSNGWAKAFLERLAEFVEEDTMTDPMFYPRLWKAAREQAAKDAAIGALSEAAKQERAARALRDQFYGQQVLLDNGICPSCLYELIECQCEEADHA